MSRPNGYSSSPSAPPMPPSWQQPAGYGTQTPNSQPSPSSSPYSQAYSQAPYSQAYSQPYAQPYSGVPPYAGGAGLPSYAYPAQYSGGYMQSLFPPGTDLEIIRAFEAADTDGSGVVDEYELRRTLSTIQNFSERTARLMIHLFGIKNSLKLGPKEFSALWRALKEWKGIFERFDRDRSGTIDKAEMRDALLSIGYAVSPPILECLLQKYDRTGQAKAMDYNSFVECGLIVKGLTEKFKEQDTQLRGSATLDYHTFMLMVLPFIVA